MEKLINQLSINDLPEPYRTIAEECGIDAVISLAKHFGGSQMYFQKLDTLLDALKQKLIREEFNGYNFDFLARKYQCSTRWVREITSDIISKERNKPAAGQVSIFE